MFSDPCCAAPSGSRARISRLQDTDTVSIGLLIADFQEEVRCDLRKLFSRSDVTVVGEATTPQQVKRLVRHGPVDVLLLDVIWQTDPASIDEGTKLLGDIREANAQLSIVMYSACESAHCVNRCRQLGANGYLVKGIDDHALLAAVHIVHYGGDVWPDRRRVWPI